VEGFKVKLNDPRRRMMGARQETWIAKELSRSVAARHAWQVIGNQVVMARVMPATRAALSPAELAEMSPAGRRRFEQREPIAALGLPTALDMWDGYPTDRERFYGLVKQAAARPIVVTGDSHSFWANDLHDAGGRRVACEFGTTGITSPGAGELAPGLDWGEVIARVNKEVVFNDQTSKGFVLLTLTRDEARADMVAVSSIVEPTFTTRVVKTFRVRPDGQGLTGVREA